MPRSLRGSSLTSPSCASSCRRCDVLPLQLFCSVSPSRTERAVLLNPTPPHETAPPLTPQRTTTSSDSWNAGALASSALLTSAVATIVVIGFLGSYGPLRDAFLAIHQSPAAASRDPRAVDGLIAVATAAVIWLKNNKAAHRYAVSVGAAIPRPRSCSTSCTVAA
jgi:hypothetical protein